jgi:hypothetical protein
MPIPVSQVVSVKILSSPTFPARQGFGLLCILGSSNVLPVGDRIRFYSNLDAVAADFGSGTEEYDAASIFFSQSPSPSRLAIARRFTAAVPGQLRGAQLTTAQQALSNFTPITNGGFDIVINGTNRQITGLNFATVTNLNAVASAVQARLAALVAGTTCVWDGQRFVISSGTTGTASTVSFAVAPTVAGTANVAGLLDLRAEDLGTITAGSAAETVTQSLDAIQQINQSWYGFTLTSEATEADLRAAMAWAEARVKIFGYTTRAANVADGTQTNDIASFAKAQGYRRTFGVWDDNDNYPVVSAMARAFAVNFSEQNSTLTLKFKTLPGNSPVNVTESQRLALTNKNINYYSYFGDSAMLAEGVMANGIFFDEVHGLDWLQNAIETNVFGYLYTRTTKVPQTDAGVLSIIQQVEMALEEGVNNGLLAPAVWNGQALGQINSGDFLTKGYYVYAAPVSTQNTSDREARKSPPIQIIATGSGAIHFVNISVTFQR